MRRYLSLHRICCCSCPSSLDIDINNLDAARCTGCFDKGAGASFKVNSSSLDGTHSGITFSSKGSYCNYSTYTVSNGVNSTYWTSGACTGATGTGDNDVFIGVRLMDNGTGIRSVGISTEITGFGGTFGVFSWSDSVSGPASLGDTLTNEYSSCGYSASTYSPCFTGGTVEVNIS